MVTGFWIAPLDRDTRIWVTELLHVFSVCSREIVFELFWRFVGECALESLRIISDFKGAVYGSSALNPEGK
jgi:hypothetical protein